MRLRVALFHYVFWNDWVNAYADWTYKLEDFDARDRKPCVSGAAAAAGAPEKPAAAAENSRAMDAGAREASPGRTSSGFHAGVASRDAAGARVRLRLSLRLALDLSSAPLLRVMARRGVASASACLDTLDEPDAARARQRPIRAAGRSADASVARQTSAQPQPRSARSAVG